ncbi:MAG TPA: hypothetical protein VK891_12680, partial [Euzebyales bacterium]|nr:hypothetical protein [Euzebyales bacterium]
MMLSMAADEYLETGRAALDAGRWADARVAFEAALSDDESADACSGLAAALWWLGENQASVAYYRRAYALHRQDGDTANAVQCAVSLAITYKANFGNFVAANGWLGRAERLLESLEPGPLHGWVWVARAYRSDDLRSAEELSMRAVDVAKAAGDVDLELGALSQLGLVRVGRGETEAGFALIDEAMAAALAGERSTLDTVVYVCCDMLNACELVSDVERAAQWCAVADEFIATFGCPFLYAECRISYGSVLTAKGRWEDAERELLAALKLTEDVCPALHARSLTRLASLRILQGRLEEAEQLLAALGSSVDVEADVTLSVAALQLARGDAAAASRHLEQRMDHINRHRTHLTAALNLLVDAHLAAGDAAAAAAAVRHLADVNASVDDDRLTALVAGARGRVAVATGDVAAAVEQLEIAFRAWSRLDLPYEVARHRFDLARVLADRRPEVAVEHARHALGSFETLGAALDADRVAAFLRVRGVTPRT